MHLLNATTNDPGTTSKVMSASTLAGYRVRTQDNQDLGTIEELMIDPQTGKVAYAVLCFGGAVSPGDRLFVVPWGILETKSDDRVLVLKTERERLDDAPAFDADEWPDFGDPEWGREIHNYYGYQPYWIAA